MSRVVVDAALTAKLFGLTDAVEICDASGRTLGYFHPLAPGPEQTSTVQSPFTREELEERRRQRTGRPLAEILEQLGRS